MRAVSEGRFRTVGEAGRWCAEVPGIEVLEGKVYYWFSAVGLSEEGAASMSAEGRSGGFEAGGGGDICG